MKHKHIAFLALSISVLAPAAASAQAPPTRTAIPAIPAPAEQNLQSFKFVGADLDTVMALYCTWTGKIYLKTDGVNASITLQADKLTIPESIDAVEAILAMNNIAILPYKDKFIKVVQANAADIVGEGADPIYPDGTPYDESSKLVTQLITLNNVQAAQVQAAIQHFMHAYGKIQILESNNSMWVTDTAATLLRIQELVNFLDQAAAKVEPRVYEIRYAPATEIASKLEQVIAMAQEDNASSAATAARGAATNTRVPQQLRGRVPQPQQAQASVTTAAGAGSSIIIQGSVKVMPDERTNLILIFSQEENFAFFDRIIEMLDVEVEPAITFEVVHLEYADATEISSTLNELVGAAQGDSSQGSATSRTTTGPRSSNPLSAGQNANPGNNNAATRIMPNADADAADGLAGNLGRLSENARILADARSNSILLMGRKSDIAAIKTVISQLDIMLEMVMIEAAIFEIGLSDSLEHGVQWLYRSQDGNRLGAWNVNSTSNALQNLAGNTLNYYQNVTGINTELAINMAKSDSDARLLATPVIMTTDNTEASLIIGEARPIVTGTSQNTYGNNSQYSYRDIGIQLTVTPHINPQRFVVMEISQQADQIGGTTTIDDNQVPIILNRSFEASIGVPDRGTVALGGLITTEDEESVSKIPILGDIPLIGRYLFSSVRESEVQRELLVLMTPYVSATHSELEKETERIYRDTSLTPDDWSWSASHLRDLTDSEDETAQLVQQPVQPAQEEVPSQQAIELQRLLDSME